MLDPEYETWYNVQRMLNTPTFIEQEEQDKAEGREGAFLLSAPKVPRAFSTKARRACKQI